MEVVGSSSRQRQDGKSSSKQEAVFVAIILNRHS